MPSFYRLCLGFSAAGIAAALLILLLYPAAAGFLCFYFFALWVLWIAYALTTPTPGYLRRLLGLWVLIDFGALVALLGMAAFTNAVGNLHGPNGSDIVLFITFAPAVIPSGLFASSIIPRLPPTLESSFGHIRADYLWAWVVMSVMAAFQSAALVVLVYSARRIARRLSPLSRASNNRWRGP
jgi:uncharacterized membrane protein